MCLCVQWNQPSVAALTAAVELLQGKIADICADIRAATILSADNSSSSTSSSDGGDDAATRKEAGTGAASIKAEDRVAYQLKALGKILRGAAEVLGDAGISPGGDSLSTVTDGSHSGVTTSRVQLIAQLPTSHQHYLHTIRRQTLQFLTEVASWLDGATPASDSGSGPSQTRSMGNNSKVRSAWLKVLNIVLARRTSCTFVINSCRGLTVYVSSHYCVVSLCVFFHICLPFVFVCLFACLCMYDV